LATTERFKDDSGKFQERTEWHSIVAWQKLAEIVGEFLSKGSKVYVEGKLQTSSWEVRQSREKKYRTEIVAKDLVLLGSHEKGNGVQPPRSDRTDQTLLPQPEPGLLKNWTTAYRSDIDLAFFIVIIRARRRTR
jgi:single-strand DNA-binding protein